MTTHPAAGVKALLEAANPSFFTGWTVELGNLPDRDKSIGIIDAGGLSPESRLSLDYPAVQIILQGSTGGGGYLEGYAKAEEIRTAILGIPAGTAAYPECTVIRQVGHINALGRTEKDRPKFTMNFQLITEPVPSGYRESL